MVRSVLIRGEEVRDIHIPACDEIVVAQQHAGNAGQEYLIRCQERDKDRRATEQVPRVDGKGNHGTNEEAFADGDVLGEQGREIVPSWQGVLEDRGENRAIHEHEGDEEAPCAIGRRVVGCLEFVEEVDRVPDELAKDDLR